jgi:tungstate transport system ATP-binding protein
VSDTPVIALDRVRVRYGAVQALAVDRLDVRAGEIVAVMGPNGSGKSTLIRVLGLLERPAEGTVRIRGVPMDGSATLEARRQIATVLQQPWLADMTVAENVALGLRFRGVSAAERERRVQPWLERLGVAHLLDRDARRLSGGEAQRVALARALVLEPAVLLLDEPFAALDAPTRAALVEDLCQILRSERITAVIVTHDRGEAQLIGDRVAVLLDGWLAQADATPTVFGMPASEDVARFLGVETILEGRVSALAGGIAEVRVGERTVEVVCAGRDLEPGVPVRIGIRPEDVTLVAHGHDGPSSARNHFPGLVQRTSPSTAHVRVVVDVGFPLVAAVTRRSADELGLGPGAAVVAIFKASAAHVLPSRA